MKRWRTRHATSPALPTISRITKRPISCGRDHRSLRYFQGYGTPHSDVEIKGIMVGDSGELTVIKLSLPRPISDEEKL